MKGGVFAVKKHLQRHSLLFLCVCFFLCTEALAQVREYELVIDYKPVNFTGRAVKAMVINNSLPGPTLRFSIGDSARIRVTNRMDVETSIHWHGILLPNRQDGVPYLTTPPIKPGSTHLFEFPIIHSGTYWYHSHTGLQEQRGVYGSIVIQPEHDPFHAGRDHVVVISDWTDEDPEEVLRTLKSGSEYYAFKKGSVQSLTGAISESAFGEMFRRSLMRMPPMDISDVAYDRFLINGVPETTLTALPGETVRLRIINASASTYFYLQFAGGPMEVVSADGMDVVPVKLNRMLMAIAETYDVLVRVRGSGAFEFRATAQDGSGHAAAWIGSGERIESPAVPGPDLYRMHGHGMSGDSMAMTSKPGRNRLHARGMHGQHSGGKMHAMKPSMTAERPLPPYGKLRSDVSTALPEDRPTREIRLNLTGDMERYVWSMNNKTLRESDSICIRRGENVRFVLENRTMMHHPMHLHGHFFRVVNDHGDHSPLKHTVDVPPLGTRVIEFHANEEKDWFFHCHVLYHMKAGMARVVHYEGSVPDKDIALIRDRFFKDHWYIWAEGAFLSNMSEGHAILAGTRHIFRAEWEFGWEHVEDTEYDLSFTYEYYVNRFLTAFGGSNLTNERNAGIIGFRYLLPLNFESAVWVDTCGDIRLALENDIQVTDHLSLFGEVEFDTEERWEGACGARWTFNKHFSAMVKWHSEFLWGAGLEIKF
jgi:FtsP/CotA-like multicopper oxidase with cupredoxin domain